MWVYLLALLLCVPSWVDAAGDHVYWSLSRDANGDAVTDDATGDAFLSTFGRILRVAH